MSGLSKAGMYAERSVVVGLALIAVNIALKDGVSVLARGTVIFALHMPPYSYSLIYMLPYFLF